MYMYSVHYKEYITMYRNVLLTLYIHVKLADSCFSLVLSDYVLFSLNIFIS